MILIQEQTTKKMPGFTSLFISFNYSQPIVDAIKTVPNIMFHAKIKVWEAPLSLLSEIIDKLCLYDSIKLEWLKDESKKEEKEIILPDFPTKPFPHQIEAIKYGLNHDKWLLLDAPGLGKAVTLDTIVPTPSGNKLMKDIQVGDVVFGADGKPTKVTAVYPQSNLKMYEVTFSDNTKVKCCEDHLWYLDSKKRKGLVKPLKWLISNDQFGNLRHCNLYWVPRTKPVQFNAQELPIHPYVLGCLLGDGCITHSISISSADIEVINRINSLLPETYICKKRKCLDYDYYISSTENHKCNHIKRSLESLHLYGTNSETKFIPEQYLYNSVENRLELLRGLLDTDGYAMKGNVLQFSSNSIELINGVKFLAESLGGICSQREKHPKFNGKIYNTNYILTIKIDNPQELVTLNRKKERLKPRRFTPLRRFKSIVPIDTTEGKCITVDNKDGLYLVNNFIVTHNTLDIIYLAWELKKREKLEHCLIICGVNTLKTNWKNEIEKHSGLSVRILGERTSKKGKVSIGSIKDRLEDLKHPIEEFFVVSNIETFRNTDIIEEINKEKYNNFDMIVLDEAHVCKSSQSQQGRNLLKLSKAKYKVAATGTLLMNNPCDCYIPLKWIGAERSTFSNFNYYYTVYGGPFHNEVIGYKNTKYLQDQLNQVSLRRTKDTLEQIGEGLPPKTVIHEFVDANDAQQKFYENIKNGIIEEVDKVDLNPTCVLGMVTRLRQATACPSILTTEPIESSKILRACDLAEQICSDPANKVVIFTTFKQTANEVYHKLSKLNPLLNTGDVPDIEIAENIKKFQENDTNKVFVATWAKCGTGITLTRASYMIFIDCAWTEAQNGQSEDRIHRIGSKYPVSIYYLWLKNSVDERVKQIVETKSVLSSYIIDKSVPTILVDRLRELILDLT